MADDEIGQDLFIAALDGHPLAASGQAGGFIERVDDAARLVVGDVVGTEIILYDINDPGGRSGQAVSALQRYLYYGGVLLINNGLGLSKFDIAVRRELAKILPEAQLQPITANHNLYSSLFPIREVRYSPVLAKNKPELKNRPFLLGVTIGGDLRVLYSPYDIEAGWLGAYYPLIKGYEPFGAQQLGMNIIAYVMTH